MKNVRVRVINSCSGYLWKYALCENNRLLLSGYWSDYKSNAIRGAKAMAKRIGIKYNPEIVKRHGC